MILCFLYRPKLSARVDDDLDLDPALQRHLHQCATCRRFYEQELSLAQNLARTAGNERAAPSPFLQARIMAALERSGRPAHTRLPLRRLAWAAGLAVALTLIVLAVHGPLSPPPFPAASDVPTMARELAALEKRLPDEQKLGQWSATLDKPLDNEMRSLFHDARNAAQALVLNFVPDSLAPSLAGQTTNE